MSDRLAELARIAGRVAVDTEFMAERHYQAMLCLTQAAVRDPEADEGIRTDVIDPLDGADPGALTTALADPAVEVVVHAGRQDVAILKRTWRTPICNLFDTQVAAGFLGYGTQESYKSLVGRVLGLRIASTESFTRWDRRPLTEEQLRYAREDARHLLELGESLRAQLAERGRLEWAREESRLLEVANDDRDPDTVFGRLPKAARLKPGQRAVARELVDWREDVARELDRNPGGVLPDHVLVELARQAPRRREQLADVRGLPAATLHRRGRDLLAAIERGLQREPPDISPATAPPADADTTVGALLSAVLRYRSAEAEVAAGLIATQDELVRLAAAVRRGEDASHLRLMAGWRRELVGDELLEVLGGRRTLTVGPGGELGITGAPAGGSPQAAG